MEKTMTIDGKEVRFKTNGAIAIKYRNQFGTDLFKDVLSLMPKGGKMKKRMTEEEMLVWFRDNVDFMVFYNIAWVLAKSANKDIPEPELWLEGFDEFPIMDIFPVVNELLASWLGTNGKK